MEKAILYIFMIFFIFVTGLVITVETQDFDTSEWNFSGSDMASRLLPYVGTIFMAVSCGVVAYVAIRGRKG